MPTVQEPQEMQIGSLGGDYPLEKEMATHFIILVQRIPWKEEPGGLQSRKKVGHNRSDLARICLT